MPAARALLAGALLIAPASSSWAHDFSSPRAFSFSDFGYSLLSPAQAAFAASAYAIVSVEKCTGRAAGLYTEDGIYANAAALKAANPRVKVLFYIHTDFERLDCYRAHAEYMRHPEWHVTDDAGNLVNSSIGVPVPNFTIPAARAFFANLALNGTGAPAAALIDGVLADGTGSWPAILCGGGAVGPARCAALVAGKSAAVRAAQDVLTAANGGVVIQNGIFMYDGLPSGDLNLYTLPDAAGIMGEHFAVFESIVPARAGAPWRYDAPRIAAFMGAVAAAAALNKTVVVAAWPGPYVGPFSANGWPAWASGDAPNTTAGWKLALAARREFALAGFLMMVERTVFLQYMGWYTASMGALYCGASTACAAPEPWYRDAEMAIGAPLAPAVRVNNTWTRAFEHAAAVFNLDDPAASSVTFFSPSATPSVTPSGLPTPSSTPTALPTPSATPSAAPTPPSASVGAAVPSGSQTPAGSLPSGATPGATQSAAAALGDAAGATPPGALAPGAAAGAAFGALAAAAAAAALAVACARHRRRARARPLFPGASAARGEVRSWRGVSPMARAARAGSAAAAGT
jgi:hypothetical protein